MGLAVLYLLGALWFLGNQGMAFWRARQSVDWPSVNGTIKYSQRQVFALDNYGNLTGIRIIYEFVLKGETHESSNVSFSPKFITARKMLVTHKVGRKVPVYYQPDNPELSTLERGITPGNYLMLTTGGLLVGLTAVNLLLQLGLL